MTMPAMASALGAYKSGEPIFFYTWAPNWTIFKLKPGEDVMWIKKNKDKWNGWLKAARAAK